MFPNIKEIKRRRIALGITQAQLALRSETSQSLIAKLESNLIEPSYSVVGRIFRALDVLESKNKIKAKDIMRKNIVTVKPTDTVARAITLMKKEEISQVPVIENKAIVGSISEKTILEKIMAENKNIKQLKVFDIMDNAFPTVNEKTPVDVLISILKHNQAVIILLNNKLAGIVTKADVLGTLGR
ncbi:MAG: CBS domain-containing protein [Candidatus Aenigmarchaeota archaeon]|nr:CBS domain-containing protein [Candidatus Aenigmarchaeota archaeon]